MQSQIVDTPEGLSQLCKSLADLDRIGLDTEFHAERRYSPELMLVQVADDHGNTWLIDPLAINIAPLGPVLASLQWVCHGSHHDIALIHKATGARPRSLLDTQIFAAMAHHRFPAGLASLADKVLGQGVPKGSALSDWSIRPLTDEQRRYAALDAVLVLQLIDRLTERLISPHGQRWAEMAGEEHIENALKPADPDASWTSLNLAPRLDDTTRRVLHHVHHWRHERAREKDQPPHFILSDGLTLSLCRNRPKNLDELNQNRRVPSGFIRRYGAEFLEIMAKGKADRRPAPLVPTAPQCQSARLLTAWSEVVGPQIGIAPKLLLPWPMAIAIAQRPSRAWSGWREEAAGPQLRDFLSGTTRLQMSRKGPRVV